MRSKRACSSIPSSPYPVTFVSREREEKGKEIPPRGILQERSLKSASFRVLNSSQLRAD